MNGMLAINRLAILALVALAMGDAHAASVGGPIVIAHRGASGYRPEHTLEGYRLAIEQGADYIEPDLVLTRDGILVARHDHYLSTTTDVSDHPEFASRKRRIGDREDWFSEDFTLAELKTLRARQAFEGRSAEHDGKYAIPTFQEVIDLVREESARHGRVVGIYPETKVPGHYKSLGFDFARILLDVIEGNGDIPERIPVYIQSFESGILRELNELCDLPLIQLVNPDRNLLGHMVPGKPDVPLLEVAGFADGVGAMKVLLVDNEGRPTPFVMEAHALGLIVHVWTFRMDAFPQQFFADGEEEMAFFLELGIDGFFTDFPDRGAGVRDRFLASRQAESD